MQFIWRNLGLMIILGGILWLAIPFFIRAQTNTTLLSGWILVVIGIIVYIIRKKRNNNDGIAGQARKEMSRLVPRST